MKEGRDDKKEVDQESPKTKGIKSKVLDKKSQSSQKSVASSQSQSQSQKSEASASAGKKKKEPQDEKKES